MKEMRYGFEEGILQQYFDIWGYINATWLSNKVERRSVPEIPREGVKRKHIISEGSCDRHSIPKIQRFHRGISDRKGDRRLPLGMEIQTGV